jgi:DNA polymerase/3'-5' exonuclease PolX
MSDKRKWQRSEALAVAQEIQASLAPACKRIAIVGSLRRGKELVGDIELLFIPQMMKRPDGLFDERIVSVADEVIEQMLEGGFIAKRPSKTGAFAWGEQNKLAVHAASGIPVDFFAEYSEPDWWRSLVVRTGSKEFNVELMTTAKKVGVIAHAYSVGLIKPSGERIPVESEREFIEKCGVRYREPCER